MSFNKLNPEELAKVADYFAIEVVAGNPEKGPTKKELLAALAAGETPLTWDDYETLYLPNVTPAEPVAPVIDDKEVIAVVVPEPVDEPVILKMERENGRFDIYGYTFTREHPYRPVTEEAADYIVRNVEGFRPATPREVADYYN